MFGDHLYNTANLLPDFNRRSMASTCTAPSVPDKGPETR